MPGRKSIFEDVVTKENSLTELLCNYLRYNKKFKRDFLEIIDSSLISNIESYKIESQVNKDEGKPDIVIKNEEVEILIEVKMNPLQGLTKYQPKGYIRDLKRLKQSQKGFLILLCPKNYLYEDEWKSKCVNNKIQTDIIYWESVKGIVRKYKNNFLFREFLNLLEELYMEIKFSDKDIKLLSSRIDTDLTDLMWRLLCFIENITEKFKDSYNIKIKPEGISECGFYFNISSKGDFFYFGFWYEYWGKKGIPIVLMVSEKWDKVVECFKDTYKQHRWYVDKSDGQKWYIEPIKISDLKNNPEYFVIKKIEKYFNNLRIKKRKG